MKNNYGVWEREGYTVVELDFDYDLHCFEVTKDGEIVTKVLTTIYPDTIEDMQSIIASLEKGEGVEDWEDGNGNPIILE